MTAFSFPTFEAALAAEIDATKREIIAAVASLATLAVGVVSGMYVATALGAVAMTLTGWAFLAACIEVFVLLGAMFAASAIAARINDWITSGDASRHYCVVRNWIVSKFTRDSSTHIKQEMAKPIVAKKRRNGATQVEVH